MSAERPPHTLTYDDWIALGVDALRREGPGALTIDALCRRARRTKGSFYHHFKTIGELRQAVVRFWIEAEADALARIAGSNADPRARLEEAWRPAPEGAPMELAVRMLAIEDETIADMVAKADERRELVLTTLVAAAWPVRGVDAHHLARTLHALHIAALFRAPLALGDYVQGPGATLAGLVTRG
jgi:AcrR family transcriptional regulator